MDRASRLGLGALATEDEFRPFLHERPAPVEEIGPPIGGLHPIRVHMRQGEFADLARYIGALRRPVPKG